MTLRAVILVVFFVAFAQAQGAENTATVTLEFDTDTIVTTGNYAVDLSGATSPDDVAERTRQVIQALIDDLNAQPDLLVVTNAMSTQIRGEHDRVMAAVEEDSTVQDAGFMRPHPPCTQEMRYALRWKNPAHSGFRPP